MVLNGSHLQEGPLFPRHERVRGIRRWLPGLALLKHYNRSLFTQDLFAGLVLTALLAPVGMGYAEATGLPAIYGLYATIVPLLVYALFGPSRILVIGPDSALTALIAATVLPLAGDDAIRAASLAAVLAILSGAICILAGLGRFGFVTDLLSKPIRHGYLNGIALTLLIGQLPKVLGFSVTSGSILQTVTGLIHGIWNGKTNLIAAVIGFTCLMVIMGCKRWAPRWPGVLFAVAGASLAVALFDLLGQAQIAVVGTLPQGLPTLHIPRLTLDEFYTLGTGAVAIAMVSIADMSVLSRIYALRGSYYVDDNQELIALGLANVATGLFQGFSVSSSASRTPVAEAAGARTQVTCMIGAVCIALLLMVAPELMRHVPTAALGAVVISASWTIMEIAGVRRLYQLRRGEFILSNVCFLGVALLGVIQGIFIAIGLSLLVFIWRAWRPYHAILGRVDGMKGYHDITRHPEGKRIPGLILFRWDAPLFFANAEMFREHILRAVSAAPTKTVWIVVAAEPVTDVDITSADMLTELDGELQQAGIQLCFAQMKGPVKDRLKTYGLFVRIGTEHFFPTIGQAVDRYVALHQVAWIDWEDAQLRNGQLQPDPSGNS
ncbi:SulP family inorganic anion transporter [Geobacter pelophilus]|uniref:SulP family inorganic anion transporter n=1 Tax=Geoanaerobacter pelophilus TaxID=60036 RepID=A0AAW4L9A4_9BACT|nr:SulP family inorganic anion transporter [Geoanaerobacter pelophilus]MBT0666155.1 SulP family inorganic anion transporter [Geoanaerobacter pelophilus]